jgi:hypothetical protein
MPINRSHFRCGSLLLAALCVSLSAASVGRGQDAGSPHDPEIYGVRIGMDVPTALEAVFLNAKRQPGQEKPDALHNEGNDKRVLYKLKGGNLQIVFAEGKSVREIIFAYAKPLRYEDLRLPYTSWIGGAAQGERYDDRYNVGYTNQQAREQFWWRDENGSEGYRIRVGFISGKLGEPGALSNKTIVRKIITVHPDDKDKFAKAVARG